MIFRNTAVRILKKNGEPYRPNEWYTSASCEREFQNILSNQTNEIKSMEPCAMMKHMCETSLVGKDFYLKYLLGKKLFKNQN